MSEAKTYPIRCPRCRHEQAAALYESVNVKTDPDLRQKLMANAINVVRCGECGLSFRVDKPLLYHDPARRIMIYLIPLADEDLSAGERQFAELLVRLEGLLPADIRPPGIGLVFNRVELVERIFLLEAGLNERIIEYLKHLLYTRNAERLDPAKKALLFSAEDSNEETLCFVVQDVATRKLEAMLKYDRSVYATMAEMFDHDEQTPRLLELFPGPRISARALLLKELGREPASPES
ncbi:MAG: CpXC domain-containing protein [Kiritimatiellae bacterium]|nr:CpXC domain-containing protein [Kiritimatiellia bacterium]